MNFYQEPYQVEGAFSIKFIHFVELEERFQFNVVLAKEMGKTAQLNKIVVALWLVLYGLFHAMKRFLKIPLVLVPHGFPEEKLGLFNLAGTQALLSSFLQFCFSLCFFSVGFHCGHIFPLARVFLHRFALKRHPREVNRRQTSPLGFKTAIIGNLIQKLCLKENPLS
jgi:hypothetical protein